MHLQPEYKLHCTPEECRTPVRLIALRYVLNVSNGLALVGHAVQMCFLLCGSPLTSTSLIGVFKAYTLMSTSVGRHTDACNGRGESLLEIV